MMVAIALLAAVSACGGATSSGSRGALRVVAVVGVSETPQPESATFQGWQLAQLLALQNALNAAALVT